MNLRDLQQTKDGNITLALCSWLRPRADQQVVAISSTDDGAYIIEFVLNGKLQPPIRVYSGKVVWPAGSDLQLMLSFLDGTE